MTVGEKANLWSLLQYLQQESKGGQTNSNFIPPMLFHDKTHSTKKHTYNQVPGTKLNFVLYWLYRLPQAINLR